jgi:hypothetical protein
MTKVIGVKVGDEVEWHAANGVAGPDHDTLCGVDANDSAVGHFGTVEAKRGQKIDCQECYNVWKGVTEMRLRKSSFNLTN